MKARIGLAMPALADQPFAHPVQRLRVQVLGRLGSDEFHRRTPPRFSDRLRILKVVLLPLGIGPHVPRRHQPGIVTKRLKLATEVMRTEPGFHADQAWRHLRQSGLHLAA